MIVSTVVHNIVIVIVAVVVNTLVSAEFLVFFSIDARHKICRTHVCEMHAASFNASLHD